jgi:hypothetical protein
MVRSQTEERFSSMAGKTSGTSRKNTPRKSSAKSKTVTPINQGDGAAQPNEQSAQSFPGIEEAIRYRAYELYEERGRQEGLHLQDWTRAEEEVLSRYRREKSA